MNTKEIGFEKHFLALGDLPADAITQLQECWHIQIDLPRKGFLIQPGDLDTHLYYVLSGELWIYYLVDGKEFCVGLSYGDTLINDIASFLTEKPSRYYIQALTPSRLIGISKASIFKVMKEYPGLESIWRKVTEFALLGRLEREYEMLSLTPQERYLTLWERSPKVFQMYSQKVLSSYLGMTPEHFSRVKKKVYLEEES